jgi:hypothetical protein
LTTNNVGIRIASYGGIIGNTTLGSNPWAYNDDFLPCLWARGSSNPATPYGVKGLSTVFMLGTVLRQNMDTCDTVSTGSRDKVFCSPFWIPWAGVTPLI